MQHGRFQSNVMRKNGRALLFAGAAELNARLARRDGEVGLADDQYLAVVRPQVWSEEQLHAGRVRVGGDELGVVPV